MGELIILGIFIMVAFISGVCIGQKLSNNEKITVNPVKIVDDMKMEHETIKEIKQENDKYDTMLRNIDNYDGSGIGQEEIPR